LPETEVKAIATTGLATFVRRADRGDLHAVFRGGRAAGDKAADFLTRHGDLFGIADPATQTVREPAQRDALGWTRVRFRQVHQGLDVYGAALVAHLAPDGSLQTVNGATAAIPGPLATTPTLSRLEAEQIAADGAAVARAAQQWMPSTPVVSRSGLVRGTEEDPRRLGDRLASTDQNEREARWSALDGRVLERVDLAPGAGAAGVAGRSRQRRLGGGHRTRFPAGWAAGTAAQVQAWQDEIDGARESYDFHGSLSLGSYLSFDGADALMATIHGTSGAGCPNASWNGVTTNYCPGVTADDVVGHEWGHAYTQFTAGLFYAWQSGALHELHSDVWASRSTSERPRDRRPGGPARAPARVLDVRRL
jgi:hypothetical protein